MANNTTTGRQYGGNLPAYGIQQAGTDTVNATLAGIDSDTNGNLVIKDVVGNTKGRAGALFSATTAAGTTITNSVAEAVSSSITLPANSIRSGSLIRIKGMVTTPSTNATDTLTIRLRMGATTLTGTAIITGAAVDVANNSFALFEANLVARAAPSAASAIVGGSVLSNVGTTSAGTAATAQTLVATNFATNGALLVEVTLQWSVASASNQGACDFLTVEIF